MVCKQCQSDKLRRIRRVGFVHTRLAPMFGYYPWRCSSCGTVQLRRARSTLESMPRSGSPEREVHSTHQKAIQHTK
jgi:hypothetical protein